MALVLKPIGNGRKSRVALAEIDPDVSVAVEEAYAWCVANSGRLETEPFADRDAAETFLKQARSYAYQRPEGRLIVVGNPAAAGTGDAKMVVRFRVEPYTAPAAEATPAPVA